MPLGWVGGCSLPLSQGCCAQGVPALSFSCVTSQVKDNVFTWLCSGLGARFPAQLQLSSACTKEFPPGTAFPCPVELLPCPARPGGHRGELQRVRGEGLSPAARVCLSSGGRVPCPLGCVRFTLPLLGASRLTGWSCSLYPGQGWWHPWVPVVSLLSPRGGLSSSSPLCVPLLCQELL